jgi:hypothetical protein
VKRVRDWDFRLLHFLGGACGSEFFLFPQSAAVSLDVVLIILAEQGRHWLVSSIPQFSGSVLRWFSLAARCLVVDDGSSFGAVLRRIWLRLALLSILAAPHTSVCLQCAIWITTAVKFCCSSPCFQFISPSLVLLIPAVFYGAESGFHL